MMQSIAPIRRRSLVVHTRDAILASILGGKFPGGKVPAEDDLAAILGVSRTTVRGALQSLAQHGLVTRTPGRGTYVQSRITPSTVALQRLIGFTRLLAEQGHEVTHEGMWSEVADQPPEVVKALGLEAPQTCYLFDRLILATGMPAIWATDYFPTQAFVRQPSTDDLMGESPFELARDLLIEPIDHAIVEIVPCLPTADVQNRLGIGRSDPYIMLREAHFGASRTPLGFSLIHVNDHFVRFEMVRTAD
ncbi:MAG TPA: GntR family transcriptional regulator [Clostridia bacterium]|nr:GntR family transcriptional regulator [Clostridia bacterium]